MGVFVKRLFCFVQRLFCFVQCWFCFVKRWVYFVKSWVCFAEAWVFVLGVFVRGGVLVFSGDGIQCCVWCVCQKQSPDEFRRQW